MRHLVQAGFIWPPSAPMELCVLGHGHGSAGRRHQPRWQPHHRRTVEPQSAYFGTIDKKHQLTVWDVAESKQRFSMPTPPSTTNLSFGSDVRYVSFVDTQQRISIRRVEPGATAKTTRSLSKWRRAMQLLPLTMQKAVDSQFSATDKGCSCATRVRAFWSGICDWENSSCGCRTRRQSRRTQIQS